MDYRHVTIFKCIQTKFLDVEGFSYLKYFLKISVQNPLKQRNSEIHIQDYHQLFIY